MPLRRISVYVEADDLEIIRKAAARKGVPAAVIIREAVHLAALSQRVSPASQPTRDPV